AIAARLVENRHAVAEPDMLEAELLGLSRVAPQLIEASGRVVRANELAGMQQQSKFHFLLSGFERFVPADLAQLLVHFAGQAKIENLLRGNFPLHIEEAPAD